MLSCMTGCAEGRRGVEADALMEIGLSQDAESPADSDPHVAALLFAGEHLRDRARELDQAYHGLLEGEPEEGGQP